MKNKILLSDIGGDILSEQAKVAQQLIDLGGAALKSLSDDIFAKLPPLFDETGKHRIANSDELVTAILNHGITGTELGKLYSGILKNSDTSVLKSYPSLEKFLIDRLLDNNKVIAKYKPLSQYGRIKELQRLGYPPEIAQKIVDGMGAKLNAVAKTADDVAQSATTAADDAAQSATTAADDAAQSTAAQVGKKVILLTDKQLDTLINNNVRMYFTDMSPKKWYDYLRRYGKEMKSEMRIAVDTMSNARTYEEVEPLLRGVVEKMTSLKQSSLKTKLIGKNIEKVDNAINTGNSYANYARNNRGKGISTSAKIKIGVFVAVAGGVWWLVNKISSTFSPENTGSNVNSLLNFMGAGNTPDGQFLQGLLGNDSTNVSGTGAEDTGLEISPKLQQIMTKYNVKPQTDQLGNRYLRIDNYPGGGIIIYLDSADSGRFQTLTEPRRTGTWNLNQLNERLSLYNLVIEQAQTNELSQQEMSKFLNTAVKDLDGWVAVYNLESLKNILTSLKGKTYKGKDATQAFYEFYKQDEGEDFIADLNDVGTSTLGVEGIELKSELLSLANGGGGNAVTTNDTNTNTNTNSSNQGENDFNLTFDDDTSGLLYPTSSDSTETEPQQAQTQQAQTQQAQTQQAQTQQTQTQQTQQAAQQTGERPKLNFRQCHGTYVPGCFNTDAIASVQRCLDLATNRHPHGSGFYDYILDDKLKSMGYQNGFTDADVSKICQADATKVKPFQMQEKDVPGESTETPRQTYEKYYAKLDGKETGRVKLKVNNIPDNDLTNLNKYFATQGLYKIKDPKRRYGTKFVWGKKPS